MNLLIATDNYTGGGVETQIKTLYEYLKIEHNVIICAAHYSDRGYLDQRIVKTGFHFDYGETIREIKEDVERLVEIIRHYKVDAIIVHPWYAIYPSFLAASLTNTKLIYVYHGTASLNNTVNCYDEMLFDHILFTAIKCVFCVNRYGLKTLELLGYENGVFIPNPIDDLAFGSADIIRNKTWALVSRLDEDKIDSILRLIKILPFLDIDELHIYGDGNCWDTISSAARLSSKSVVMKGFSSNILKEIRSGYTGVVGLGRAALEGLAMGYPVLLIGYGKICGIVDEALYESIKYCNFVPDEFEDISVNQLQQQIELVNADPSRYELRRQVKADFGVSVVGDKIIRLIADQEPYYASKSVVDLCHELVLLPCHLRFHESEEVWSVIRQFLFCRTQNPWIQKEKLLLDEIMTNRSQISELRQRLAEYEYYMLKVDNMNTKKIVQNDVRLLLQKVAGLRQRIRNHRFKR